MKAADAGRQLLTRSQSFILTGYSTRPATGTVQITSFTHEQRARRAFAELGKWWGASLLAVFIPVAHFVLVPAFLVYGAVQCIERWRTAEGASNARATCPDCGHEQVFDIPARWRVPQAVTCRACQRGLEISIS
ncbi:MAG TPA: hypothetical protein VLV45_09095 [Gemmatimonadales bacterium]|nr:hypothetical protein [Gemmatimonadales bacterium]